MFTLTIMVSLLKVPKEWLPYSILWAPIVAQKAANGGTDNINLGSGLYLVKLQTADGEVTRKVVVK